MVSARAGNADLPKAHNRESTSAWAIAGGEIKPGPAYWNSPAGGLIYIWAQHDVLRAFHFNGSTLGTPAYASGSVQSPGSPGGTLSISANGGTSGTGVVWAELSTSQNDDHGLAAGILRAYNAQTLQQIWNSEQLSTRDRLGTLVKFVPPVVANGKCLRQRTTMHLLFLARVRTFTFQRLQPRLLSLAGALLVTPLLLALKMDFSGVSV